MNTSSDAPWSHFDDGRYRFTHHKRTKQRERKEQRVQDSWTWEELLDGKGPWSQAGEYRCPKEELEAAKAERRWYEARERNRHERQPPKNVGACTRGVWQSQVGDLSQLLVLTRSSMVLVRHRVML